MKTASRVAACDPPAFYPLRSLVAGPLRDLGDLAAIERFVRTVVLHDEIVMEIEPIEYDRENDFELSEEEERAGGRVVIIGFAPVLHGYEFFTDNIGPERPVPEIELSAVLVDAASQHANAGEGNMYFGAAIKYLKRLVGTIEDGGSVLLAGNFEQVLTAAEVYPAYLFKQLDLDWQGFARDLGQNGFSLTIPPVLGIVLSRCARREAIPTVIRDLRDEWSVARRKVWERLDALRRCRTLGEALEIRREISDASRLFSPNQTEVDSKPARVFWDLVTAALAGGVTGHLSGASPIIGAMANVVVQLARSLPPIGHEFGPAIFGRGAFDLARKVRTAASQVEFDALRRLLSEAENRKLGLI